MEKRRLGNSELLVPPLCFGGNVFGWTTDETVSFKLLDASVESGVNFVDTADVYSRWVPGNQGGESETIIGKWLRRTGRRKDVVIASKAGKEMGPGKTGLSKAYLFEAVEQSLRRLQTDYIDLYQAHQDDPVTPIEETLEAFTELIKQGKVRVIGASNFTAARLSQALEASSKNGYSRYESLQPHYNLYERAEYESTLESVCLKHQVGIISYYSLASGFLTGKYRSQADAAKSPRGKSAAKYLDERGLKILAALDEVAAQHSSTPARVALAWLIARPSITAPIASATTIEQLNDLVEATRLELDQPSIEMLNSASAY
ncbi:MAG TPA: aldo/keto reductase [Terriglobales bacterium]|nr:aldo/keto reductase [Terriglobales bacterium]